MKLTATYAVANNSDNTVVTMNVKSNMTENDVKKMMIDQMQKMGMGEEVTSQIEANWGQFKSMGMANISATGTDYLTFLPNGWLQNTTGTANTKVMGMDMKFDTKCEISYKNWKLSLLHTSKSTLNDYLSEYWHAARRAFFCAITSAFAEEI